MPDTVDSLLIDVRANTQGFAADVAAMRSTFDSTLVDGFDKAGAVLERGLLTRPRADSVVVSLDGAATTAFTLDPGGVVRFTAAPAAGKLIKAGFLFDVPVRFAEDRLEVAGAVFAAGEAPSVPVIEVREDGA